jgi:DUF1680 family protein
MRSNFPFDGHATLIIMDLSTSATNLTAPFTIRWRQPSWMGGLRMKINGIQEISYTSLPADAINVTASGFDPRAASFYALHRNWAVGDEISIEFEMPVLARHAHPKMKGHRGKTAITRGPIVYCLESVDNPDVDIFIVRVNTDSLEPELEKTELGEIMVIHGTSISGQPLTFIPYFLWGNRGPSQMTVWVNE